MPGAFITKKKLLRSSTRLSQYYPLKLGNIGFQSAAVVSGYPVTHLATVVLAVPCTKYVHYVTFYFILFSGLHCFISLPVVPE